MAVLFVKWQCEEEEKTKSKAKQKQKIDENVQGLMNKNEDFVQ